MTANPISGRAFAQFYLPLAATSLLLTSTNPLLAAALARTADPAAALAGYSVAFALVGVLYSPLLVVQQVTATRLLDGHDASAVRRFAIALGTLLSIVAALVAFTSAGTWVFGSLVGVTGAVLDEAMGAMVFLWPVPLLTGLRSHHQGRLVAGHRTRPIALATGVRTAVLAAVAFGMVLAASGAWLGAVAFSAGLLVETVLVMLSPGDPPVVRSVPGRSRSQKVARFSTPLMINVLLWWSTPLVINAVLARTPAPESALATFAVVEAIAWFITAPVGQLQHATIALVDGRISHGLLRRWAGVLSVVMALALGLVALPGVRDVVLGVGFRLDVELLALAGSALPIAAIYPLLYGHRQYYQGLFVRAGSPDVVGWGAVFRLTSIVVGAVALLGPLGHLGAGFGVGLAAVGLVVEGVWLERLSHSRALPYLDHRPRVSAGAVSG